MPLDLTPQFSKGGDVAIPKFLWYSLLKLIPFNRCIQQAGISVVDTDFLLGGAGVFFGFFAYHDFLMHRRSSSGVSTLSLGLVHKLCHIGQGAD